jgi:hypothetical protein
VGVISSSIISQKSFDGVGPTVAAESRVALGDHGLSIYGNCRGSLIVNQADSNSSGPTRSLDPRSGRCPVSRMLFFPFTK